MKNIAFLLPVGTNLASLDSTRQGFLAANQYLKERGRTPCFAMRFVAATPQVRLEDGRYTVHVDALLDEVRGVDLCIVPPLASLLPDTLQANRAMIDWIARHYKSGGEVASQCTGAALLAAAGLLDGQRAVVHWSAQNQYASLFPAVQWVCDQVVAEGNGIYTSGGAFSAAHVVLHLIEKYIDRDAAIWCAKLFQLDWSRQSQLPFAIFSGRRTHGDAVVRQVQDHIEARYAERVTVDQLATRYALGRRTLERRFRQATGNSVVEYLQRIRVEAAKSQLEGSSKTVAEVMAEVGYSDAKAFREIFGKHCGMSPAAYRERYA